MHKLWCIGDKKNGGAGNLNKKKKSSGKKVFVGVAIAGVVLTGIIVAIGIGISKRSEADVDADLRLLEKKASNMYSSMK